jgi:hypothetical protein
MQVKILAGEFKVTATQVPFGANLVEGEQYFAQLANNDDFSNVGYVAENQIFTAAETVPAVWQDTNFPSLLYKVELEKKISFNELDPNFEIELLSNGSLLFQVTNVSFEGENTIPLFPQVDKVEVLDANNIQVTGYAFEKKNYFKIEVYDDGISGSGSGDTGGEMRTEEDVDIVGNRPNDR